MSLILTPDVQLVARRDVLASDVGDQASILLDPQSGRYFSIEGAGMTVWAALATPSTVASLAELVQAEYAVDHATCERDVVALLDDLIGRGLVEVVVGGAGAS